MALPTPTPEGTSVVTGASSGIGAEIARVLARRGRDVYRAHMWVLQTVNDLVVATGLVSPELLPQLFCLLLVPTYHGDQVGLLAVRKCGQHRDLRNAAQANYGIADSFSRCHPVPTRFPLRKDLACHLFSQPFLSSPGPPG